MVLLDGFPEFQDAWRHQIPALAEAGYRIAGPDLPATTPPTSRPECVTTGPGCWPKDVADLIVALGAGSATVAGHDWGGALAWLLAMQHPEHVE
jgi:epoxide hydrolase 4